MSIFKLKKRELTEEQKKSLYQSGEKFADKIHLKEKVDAINNFGNKKPKLFFAITFIVIIGLLVLSYIFPLSTSTAKLPEVTEESLKDISSSEEEFRNQMLAIYTEMEMITDTLLIMMEKENLSREDSAFMVEKYSRLEELNYIINQELNLDEGK